MDSGAGWLEPRRDGWHAPRLSGAIALAVLVGVSLCKLAGNIAFYSAAVSYPYAFDYGEGIVWQQMRDIWNGSGYGPIGAYPAVVYHYPPIFHLMTAAIAEATRGDELATGRIVEIAATFVTAGLIALAVTQAVRAAAPYRARVGAGILAALLFLNLDAVVEWAPRMRVDMLAGALSMLGIVLSIRALERPASIYLAAAAFVLSIYTKQTMIAAPLAVFAVLAIAVPRLAWRGIFTALAGGLIVLALASWTTRGGFLRHIVLYNVNSLDPTRFKALGAYLLEHLPILALAAIGAGAGFAQLKIAVSGTGADLRAMQAQLAQSRPATVMAILLLFAAIKTAMLVMVVKSGSSTNYLIEWFATVCMFAGIAAVPMVARALGERVTALPPPALLLAALVAVGLPAQILLTLPRHPTEQQLARRERALDEVVRAIAASPKPVVSDDMTLLLRAGRDVAWEPAIVAELTRVGQYDEKPFVHMVEDGRFAFFVTEGPPARKLFRDRYSPAIRAAMRTAYPREETVEGMTLHLPATSSHGP